MFTDITPPSTDEIQKPIRSMPAKSSPLDKISASFIKTCAGVFTPLIARLVTLSISECKFPVEYKHATAEKRRSQCRLLVITGSFPTCIPFRRSLNTSTYQGLQLTSGAHQTTAVSSQPTSVATALKWHFSECRMTYTALPVTSTGLHYCSLTYLRRLTLWTRALYCGDFDSLMVYLAQLLTWLVRTCCVARSQFASDRNSHRASFVGTAFHKDPCSDHCCSQCTSLRSRKSSARSGSTMHSSSTTRNYTSH